MSSAMPPHSPPPPPSPSKRHRQDDSPASSRASSRSRSSSHRRPSFDSIKEDDTGIQSFVHSKGTSDLATTLSPTSPAAKTALPLPATQIPDFCCPCGTFRGWKRIPLAGRRQSKSFSDLTLLGGLSRTRGWAWEDHHDNHHGATENNATLRAAAAAAEQQEMDIVMEEEKPSLPPKSRACLEMMPPEILDQIISLLFIEVPPNGYTPRNIDLISCLLTCRTLHSATLGVLYRNITIPHSFIFAKALNHIRQYPSLGTIVRRLDFSHFSPVGLGRTQRMNADIQNLTARTLLECLELLPNLKELLLQEHLESDIDAGVLRKIFERSPALRALDFCAASNDKFKEAIAAALINNPDLPQTLPNLRRISFHECSGLQDQALQSLLPRLVNLTHLDVAHTFITPKTLSSIHPSARLTHLNLSRCTKLTGPEVVEFLTTHPAVRDSLVYLNLMVDVSRHLLFTEEDVDALLPHLSNSLRSLNLGGARVSSKHMPLLIELSKHIEELGLNSADITVEDINSFFAPPQKGASTTTAAAATAAPNNPPNWVAPNLHYLDLTKNPYITQTALLNPKACLLATPRSRPLDVIELSEKTIAPLRKRRGGNWVVRDLGRRTWYVRESPPTPGEPMDDGRREWKMGARWWGMRKIPVTVGEVGGIYGHYMFKK